MIFLKKKVEVGIGVKNILKITKSIELFKSMLQKDYKIWDITGFESLKKLLFLTVS
jgi:hypothetical protein